MPSLRYSFCLSSLRFSNGKTAIDLSGIAGPVVGGESVDRVRTSWITNRLAAIVVNRVVKATSFRPVLGAIDLRDRIFDSRFIPSGVISNAQEKTRTAGKPRTSNNTTRRTAQFGIPKNGNT